LKIIVNIDKILSFRMTVTREHGLMFAVIPRMPDDQGIQRGAFQSLAEDIVTPIGTSIIDENGLPGKRERKPLQSRHQFFDRFLTSIERDDQAEGEGRGFG
jgi:hypothetical protein